MSIRTAQLDLGHPREVVPKGKPKLLVFVGNPTQYHSPIFRKLSDALEGKIQVMYGDEIGARPFFNPEVNSIVKWDVPLLSGFPYKIFENWASSERKGFLSRNNPKMFAHVLFSPATHVLLHGYDTLSSWYVYGAAKISGKKILWRGETVRRTVNVISAKSLVKQTILPLYFRGVHKILWSCLNNLDQLSTYAVKADHKFVRFPCAVDNEFFYTRQLDADGRENARLDHGIAINDMVIVTCSRLTERKKTRLILEAMSKMTSKEVTLVIVGDGPLRQSLESLAIKLGVRVKITGFVGQREVANYLALSDVFCLLSDYDASPKALNEAMNFSLAMLVSNGVGTARDLVRVNQNGYVFESDSVENLVLWLDGWSLDPKSRIRAGQCNKEILADYTIEEGVTNLVDCMSCPSNESSDRKQAM